MRLSTSEQIRVEMKRKNITQTELGEMLHLTQITICNKLKDNIWKPAEVYMIKHELGFNIE